MFTADRVILCTGGKSSPNLGSNGGGFKIAQALGHNLVTPFPALVQVCLDAPYLNHLAGAGFQGQVQVLVDGAPQRTETGELLFAKYGISGTAILQVSRIVSEAAMNHRETCLRIDLFPEDSQEALVASIQERIAKCPAKSADFCFVGFLHKRLIPVLLRLAGIEPLQRPCGELVSDDIARIAGVFKSWEIPCTGTQSWMFSQVTAGGIDTREVDPVTLESKRARGVHFAGEILDVDGDSGGFNLQWAWSSGAVAALHAAQTL